MRTRAPKTSILLAALRACLCAGLCLGAGAAQAAEGTAAPAVNLPDIQRWTDASGAVVSYIGAPELPMVDIDLRFDAGSARDGAAFGIASMTSGMLKFGADGMDAEAIISAFAASGAHYGAGASSDSSQLSLRSLTDPAAFKMALDTFIAVVARPDFPDKMVELRRTQALSGIRARGQNIGTVGRIAFRKALYGDHPYGHPVGGDEDTVAALTAKDLARFHRAYYVAANLKITIVGAIDRAQAEAIARRIASALPRGEKPPPLPAPRKPARVFVHIPFPSQQAHVFIGHPLIEVGHPDAHLLGLGNRILGGGGFGSRMLDEIRVKRGLAYSSYSYFSPRRVAGPFAAGFQTRLDQAGQAIAVARQVMDDFIAGGPRPEELEAAKNNILAGYALRFAGNGKMLGQAAYIGFYDLPVDHLARHPEDIARAGAADIQTAFSAHVHPDRMVTVVVGGDAPPSVNGETAASR